MAPDIGAPEPQSEKAIDGPTAKETLELLHMRAVHNVEQEVVRLIRWRYSIAVALIAAVGIIGIGAALREFVRSHIDQEISRAKAESMEAVKAAALATAATRDARTQTEAYAKTVGDLQGRATAVDDQFAQVRRRLEEDSRNVSAGAKRDADVLRDRIVRLEALVTKLSDASRANQELVETYRKELAAKEAQSAADAKRFAENSAFRVTVYSETGNSIGQRAVDLLTRAGFKTSFAAPASLDPPASPGRNIIRYTPDARSKSSAVRDLLRPIAQFGSVDEIDGGAFTVGASAVGGAATLGGQPWIQVILGARQ